MTTGIPSTTGLANVFKRAIPANKVIDLLKVVTELRNNGQRDAISHLKRYLRGLLDEKLRKVLGYLTGANVICIETIEIIFTCLDGFERHPMAHTCGPSLELLSTYEKFAEFRQEINSIINSEFWEMNIA